MTTHDSAAQVEAFLLGDSFPCLAGRSGWRQKGIHHRHYAGLGDQASARHLTRDLHDYIAQATWAGKPFTSFVATFTGPLDLDEVRFEQLLWRHLQFVHNEDCLDHPWAAGYSSDPASSSFAFSVAGHPFFVIGLHENHSRGGRRPPFPMLAFNSLVLFDNLKANGTWPRLQDKIRKQDIDLHGSINPNLADLDGPDARRYSGRRNTPDWVCPFTASTEERSVAPVAASAPAETTCRHAEAPRILRDTREHVAYAEPAGHH